MERFKNAKSSRQSIFIMLAIVMIIIVMSLVAYFIVSLGNGINATLKLPPRVQDNTQFDIQAFQKLNLTQ